MSATGITYQPFAGLTGSDELERVWLAFVEEFSKYLGADAKKELLRTAVYGAKAHEGQKRQSGEPYFTHPIEVAKILAEKRFDLPVLQAALLHDVLEDTPVTKKEMAGVFGVEITAVVDGVSKIERLKDQASEEALAVSFYKMLVAATDDPRVIIVKLADRVHNMQTLGALRPDKRLRKVKETLDIYAPIAGHLGLFCFRMQLEDLAFSHLYPWRYAVLKKRYDKRFGANDVFNRVRQYLAVEFTKRKLAVTVQKRRRHLWELYLRMKRKGSFDAACSTVALQVITEDTESCYFALGILHSRYRPLSEKFKDYIGAPKSNGYLSLHTSVVLGKRLAVNVQIRTAEMNQLAEMGIISAFYQNSNAQTVSLDQKAEEAARSMRDWLSRLQAVKEITDDSVEFYDIIKKELNHGHGHDDIHVYTPNGDVINLPKDATPVDMGYAIHKDIGNHCMGARVNGEPYPIFRPLKTTQTVEILTDKDAHPHAGWLQFVVTDKAKGCVRSYLRKLKQSDAEVLGRRLFDAALLEFGRSFDSIPAEKLDDYLEKNQLTLNTLFSDIAFGERQAGLIVSELFEGVEFDAGEGNILYVQSALDSGILLAECCHPLYDDKLIGHIVPGKGIHVHRKKCSAVQVTDGQGWLRVRWGDNVHGPFVALLGLDVKNRPGVLLAITDVIASCGGNIDDFQMKHLPREKDVRRFKIWVEVHHRNQLAQVIRGLRLIDGVDHIKRL